MSNSDFQKVGPTCAFVKMDARKFNESVLPMSLISICEGLPSVNFWKRQKILELFQWRNIHAKSSKRLMLQSIWQNQLTRHLGKSEKNIFIFIFFKREKLIGIHS